MSQRRQPQGGKVADPAWRTERGRKGGLASRATYRARVERDADRFSSKGTAYAAGYRRGYQTAMAWWRRRSQRKASA